MKENLSRRDFLKIAGVGLSAISALPFRLESIHNLETTSSNDTMVMSLMTESAVNNAIQSFGGAPYDWNTNSHCSSFASKVVTQFGYPEAEGFNSNDINRFSKSGTVFQSEWLKKLDESLYSLSGKSFGTEVPMKQILKTEYWEHKNPGTLVYLASAISHNGYNKVSHVAVFNGIGTNGPSFAEFSPAMLKGPQTNRTLEQLSSMYIRKSNGERDLKPFNTYSDKTDELIGYVWDTIGASREMWRDGGVVVPEGNIVNNLEESTIITVNTNDGTIGYWRNCKDKLELIPINSEKLPYAYSAIGRRLRSKSSTTATNYYEAGMGKLGVYDTIEGEWFSQKGSPRRTLTPPLTILLNDVVWVDNFGKIGGRSHILLGHPAEVTKNMIKTSPPDYYSSYTLHEVPRNTGIQEILLREPLIKSANIEGHPLETPFLSSGCVNLDELTWQNIIKLIKKDLNKNPVFLVFSVPNFPTDLTMQKDFMLGTDPFGSKSGDWKYIGTDKSEQISIVRQKENSNEGEN